jgi:CubicO group peptidase (beta-lactamase class C family)
VPTLSKISAGPLASALSEILGESPDGTSAPPGALIALTHGDRTVYVCGGVTRHGSTQPLDWSTRTDAGSVTKIMATTAALMALHGAGAVDLDAPVARYLPQAIHGTVGDLLEHQAGLWEWWPLYLSGARDAEAVTLAAGLPPRYPPHSGRRYSDLDFILLGALVARVAGGDLAAAVRDLVLTPFGLDSTRYAAPAPGGPVAASSAGDGIERQMVRSGVPYPVSGSVDDFPGWRTHTLVGEVNDGNAYHAFGGTSGHAGLFTTAADLLDFATGLRRSLLGDGPVPAATLRRFLAPGRDPGQVLGLRHWRLPAGPAYGHTGFPGVAFALLPEQDASLVMITNRLNAPGPPRSTEDMWRDVLHAAELQLARS